MHRFRSRLSKRSVNNAHSSSILPSRYDDDDAKYMSKLPSGALYGGCYYQTKHAKRRGAFRGHFICAGIIVCFCFFLVLLNTIIVNSVENEDDLNVINGIRLMPVETLRDIEMKRQQVKLLQNGNGKHIQLHSDEQLKIFRQRIPEWSDFGANIIEDTEKGNRGEFLFLYTFSWTNDEMPTLTRSYIIANFVGDNVITINSMDTSSSSCSAIDSSSFSVSLVYQGTLDRVWILEETCKRWTDPIVVVIYIEGDDLGEDPWKKVFDWERVCPQSKVIPYYSGRELFPWEYPVNKLRNIGLNALETSHFIVVDIDFVPSSELKETVHSNFQFLLGSRDAMVIPAFERYGENCDNTDGCKDRVQKDPSFVPYTFEDLTRCIFQDENCSVFQSQINWTGHYSTRSELWLEKEWSIDKKPRSVTCFKSDRYEPYVVLRWCKGSSAYYDERFTGYGKNKIEYISHMRYLGYTFKVLAGPGYIIHVPHGRSTAKESWENNEEDLHRRMDSLYQTFLTDLELHHGKPLLGLC